MTRVIVFKTKIWRVKTAFVSNEIIGITFGAMVWNSKYSCVENWNLSNSNGICKENKSIGSDAHSSAVKFSIDWVIFPRKNQQCVLIERIFSGAK